MISDREFPLQRLNAPDVAVDVFCKGTTMRGRKHRTKKRSWKTNRCGSRYSPDKNLALFQRYESLRGYQNSKSESRTVESSSKLAANPQLVPSEFQQPDQIPLWSLDSRKRIFRIERKFSANRAITTDTSRKCTNLRRRPRRAATVERSSWWRVSINRSSSRFRFRLSEYTGC